MTKPIKPEDLEPIQKRVTAQALVGVKLTTDIGQLLKCELANLGDAIGDLAKAESAHAMALADISEDLEALIESGGGQPEPPEPPAEDVIFELHKVTQPKTFIASSWMGATFFAGVIKVPAAATADTKYRKFVGCDSTKGLHAGLCAGTVAGKAEVEFWVDDGIQSNPPGCRLGITADKASFFAMEIKDKQLLVEIDGREQVRQLPDGHVPFDWEASVYQGYWDHKPCDPATPIELRAVLGAHTAQDKAALKAKWAELIDPEPEQPPVNGGNGGIQPGDEFHVNPDMSPQQFEAAYKARGVGARVNYAPGTYRIPTVHPLNGQQHVGDPGNPRSRRLDGQKQNKRAFAGRAVEATISGLMIAEYASGGPTSLNPGVCGSNRGPWIFKMAAICPQTLDPQTGAGGPAARAWTLDHLLIDMIYAEGVNYCDQMTIRGCEVSNCGSCGTSGFATQVTIDGCNMHHNSRWHWNARDHAGGIKTQAGYGRTHAAMRSYRILRTLSHDNWGPGFWSDYNMWDYEIAHCSFWNNAHNQLQLEACAEFDIHHNQFGLGGSSLGGTLQGTVLLQNAKHIHLYRNLIGVSCPSALWILQHNKTNRPNISDAHVGLFAACHNTVQENVFLLMNPAASFKIDFQGNQDFSGDPNCATNAVPASPDCISPRSHHFCFFPHSVADMQTRVESNTYRLPGSGQTPARISWPEESNPKILSPGDPGRFIPDWTQVPTWDVPPGAG